MTKPAKCLYEFGSFHLDTTERVLHRSGQEIVLPPQPYAVLLFLIESSGRIVDKEEIMQRCWPNRFVGDDNIYENISKLRKILREGGDNHGYIETIPKRGYRFTAAVREIVGEDESLNSPDNRGQWMLVISATIKDIDKPLAEAIEAHLGKLSKDVTLTLTRIKEGSVILIFKGTRAGFERISELVKSGRLSEVFGFDIENLRWELSSEGTDIQSHDTVQTYPEDLSHWTEGALALDKGLNPFDNLLLALGVDREQAGIRYMKIREELIKLFKRQGVEDPEELADTTIDRVAKKIEKVKETFIGNLESYFYAVAMNTFREYSMRRSSNELMPGLQIPDVEGDEADKRKPECLKKCLSSLSHEERELVLTYYKHDKNKKIENRKDLAVQLGISISSLRIRAHRIKSKLGKCISDCLERESIDV